MNIASLIKTAALMGPALVSVGCASMNRPRTYGLEPHAAAVVRQTCTDIMGLTVSVEYEACGTSLAETVQHIEKAKRLAHADQHCETQRDDAGISEQAKCVVLLRNQAARPSASHTSNRKLLTEVSLGTSLLPVELPAKRYYSMNRLERQQRMELSCAQLGLHPAWGAFESCVTNLGAAIADTDVRSGRLP